MLLYLYDFQGYPVYIVGVSGILQQFVKFKVSTNKTKKVRKVSSQSLNNFRRSVMKHKKKHKNKKIQLNVQSKNRELKKDKNIIKKSISDENALTIRGVLLYWWFWHDSRYFKDFEKVIDEFGEELVLNAVVITLMHSNIPVQVLIFAIKNNLINLFITRLNFNILNLSIYEKAKYQETKNNLIETTLTKYRLDKKESQIDLEETLRHSILCTFKDQ